MSVRQAGRFGTRRGLWAGSGPDMPFGHRKSRLNRRLSAPRSSHFVAEPGYFVAVLASQAGFEPATRCLEGSRSVP